MDQEILELNRELNDLRKQCKLQETSMAIISIVFLLNSFWYNGSCIKDNEDCTLHLAKLAFRDGKQKANVCTDYSSK